MSKVIDGHDAVAYTRDLGGQAPDLCVVFFMGRDTAVVNLDRMERVTLFRYSRGVSDDYDAIWDSVHK